MVINTYSQLEVIRPIQEYCKPMNQEQLTIDFDDVCAQSIAVARNLCPRADFFQLKMIEAIGEVTQILDLHKSQRPQSHNMSSQLIELDITPLKDIRTKFEKELNDKADQIGMLIEKLSECPVVSENDQADLNREYTKFMRLKHCVEECYLKEKLVFKRALVLCRSLLKYC